jgi:copper(I)-binding protein
MDSQSTTPVAAAELTTAAFLKIKNSGTEDDRLLRVETDLAQAVEIHLSEIQNDVMTMRPVGGIDLLAGETVELKPGGYHIMLIRLLRELKPGEIYPLTLVFEKASPLIVDAEVRAP